MRARLKRVAEGGLVLFLSLVFLGFRPALAAQEDNIGRQFEFDIPQQAVETALTEFAEQADLTLVFPDDLVREKSSNALIGKYTLQEGIDVLLSGTGLIPKFSNEIVLSISADEQSMIKEKTMNVKKKAGLWAAILGMFAGGVSAQDAPANMGDAAVDSVDNQVMEEVLVQSSATRLTSGFESPKPTTTIDSQAIDARGLSNLADVLNELPGFIGSATPQSNTISGSDSSANLLNLRQLGTGRALVLIDKRRSVAGFFGGVDINNVPQMLVQQVEVVTGGASAQWGSDAISGVVNIQQDRTLEGGKLVLRYGQTSENDAKDKSGSFAYGFSFADGRGHLSIGGDYQDNSGVGNQADRDWSAKSWGIMQNPDDTGPDDGIPARVVTDDVRLAWGTSGGYLWDAYNYPSVGWIHFGPGGELLEFDKGWGAPWDQFQKGGSGGSMGLTTSLMAPMERKSATALFDYNLTDDLNFFFDVSYAESVSDNEIVPPWNLLFWGPDFIPADNPYIPADLQTIMADNGVPYLILSRINEDLGFITDNTETETQRFATGLQGEFGDWSWEAYYSHGEIDTKWLTSNNPIGSKYTSSVDAVRDSSGQIVCRANADGANGAPGCVPVNLFGVGAPSQEALDYFLGTAVGWVDAKQDVVAAAMQGEIFDLPAGPVAVAFGLEYRKEEGSVDYDEIGQEYGYFWGGGQPIAGDFDVKEAFVEAGIPVFDTDGGTSLDINAAVRYADYSSSGGVTPWQFGATLGFASDFTLRGTFSNDIRAPGISELYAVESRSFRNITNPDTGESKNTLIWGGGNPNLGVEDAETMTLGFIWQPGDFALAVDYYKTEISDAIGTLSAQAIVDSCYEYGIACNNVEVVDGEIVSVSTRLFNIAERTTEGIDFEATYAMSDVVGGDLTFRMLLSHYMEVSFSPDRINVIDDVGVVGSDSAGGIATPEWRGNLSADYVRNDFGLNVQMIYIGGGDLLNDQTIEDINDNSVSSQTLFNLGLRYNFAIGDTNLQLFGGINNIFDQDPPIAASDFISNWSSNPAVYNLIGRNYYAGVRFDF